jgi:hypothetical protein
MVPDTVCIDNSTVGVDRVTMDHLTCDLHTCPFGVLL